MHFCLHTLYQVSQSCMLSPPGELSQLGKSDRGLLLSLRIVCRLLASQCAIYNYELSLHNKEESAVHFAVTRSFTQKRSSDNNEQRTKNCNCRVKEDCPLQGACLTRSVVYKAKVKMDDDEKTYTGLTEGTFKQRYNNHQSTFRQRKYEKSTELSKYIWKLKDAKVPHTITWSIHRRATAYTCGSKRCNLCLAEKLAIISAARSSSLNRRSELVSKCRHENKLYLCNFTPD